MQTTSAQPRAFQRSRRSALRRHGWALTHARSGLRFLSLQAREVHRLVAAGDVCFSGKAAKKRARQAGREHVGVTGSHVHFTYLHYGSRPRNNPLLFSQTSLNRAIKISLRDPCRLPFNFTEKINGKDIKLPRLRYD